MAICEKCGKEHDGSFGSGRFCCRACANSRTITKEHKHKVANSMREYYKTEEGKVTRQRITKRIKEQVLTDDMIEQRVLKMFKTKGLDAQSRYVTFTCPVCGTQLQLRPSVAKKRKYCCGTCRNIANNKKHCGTRSKAEIELEKRIRREFASLEFVCNDRTVLDGLELDFYFPTLKLAVEWNGIFHYKDVGHNIELIQQKDKLKQEKCSILGVTLFVVKDLTSSSKFISQQVDIILNLIKQKQEELCILDL